MTNSQLDAFHSLCVCAAGGTLKIYGETLCPEVPYKTLLLSMNDTAAHVVRETLDKYGMEKEDAHRYCLLQVQYIHRVTDFIFPLKPGFKLCFKPNFGVKPN